MSEIKLNTSSLDNSFEKRMGEEEREKIKPVVSKGNGLVSAKPSFLKRVKNAFVSEDGQDISDYFIFDIIVPGIKNAILDTLERVFFNGGSSSRRKGSKKDDYYGRTSYSSYYKSSRDRDRRDRDRDKYESSNDIDYRNIIVDSRENAEEIVSILRKDIEDHDSTSVARLIDCIGAVAPFTYNNYGWTDVRDICIKRVREGYLIDVPEAEPIGD